MMTAHQTPIETDRLILRLPELGDFEAAAGFWTSERSATIGGPLDRQGAWTRFASYAGSWMLRGYGSWMVVEKSSNTPVGSVGIYEAADWPEPELGWVMFEAGEGKGYAYEAAIAARTYIYAKLNMPALISTIAPDNTRSLALAERLGAKLERMWQSPFGPLGIYRHPKAEVTV